MPEYPAALLQYCHYFFVARFHLKIRCRIAASVNQGIDVRRSLFPAVTVHFQLDKIGNIRRNKAVTQSYTNRCLPAQA